METSIIAAGLFAVSFVVLSWYALRDRDVINEVDA